MRIGSSQYICDGECNEVNAGIDWHSGYLVGSILVYQTNGLVGSSPLLNRYSESLIESHLKLIRYEFTLLSHGCRYASVSLSP